MFISHKLYNPREIVKQGNTAKSRRISLRHVERVVPSYGMLKYILKEDREIV